MKYEGYKYKIITIENYREMNNKFNEFFENYNLRCKICNKENNIKFAIVYETDSAYFYCKECFEKIHKFMARETMIKENQNKAKDFLRSLKND